MRRCVPFLSVMAVLLLSGCITTSEPIGRSGFLRDYKQLKPDPNVEGALRFDKPGVTYADYNKFIIDPVIVHFAPTSDGRTIDPMEVMELASYFHTNMVKELAKETTVVTKPGPHVLRVRVAITDISKSVPALNIHPATKLSGLGLGGASMEAEGIDSVTGERIGAVVETQTGNRMSLTAGLTVYGHARQVMDGWIERFVGRIRAGKEKLKTSQK